MSVGQTSWSEVITVHAGPGVQPENCYILVSKNFAPGTTKKEAVVIDPGGNFQHIAATIEQRGLQVVAYALTHGHADHVGALGQLHKKYRAPVCIGRSDLDSNGPSSDPLTKFVFPNLRAVIPEGDFVAIEHDNHVRVGQGTLEVITTPGHSPGSVIYRTQLQDKEGHESRIAFSGDTLLHKRIGPTWTPGADLPVYQATLTSLETTIPNDVALYPGHGPQTTMGAERENIRVNKKLLQIEQLFNPLIINKFGSLWKKYSNTAFKVALAILSPILVPVALLAGILGAIGGIIRATCKAVYRCGEVDSAKFWGIVDRYALSAAILAAATIGLGFIPLFCGWLTSSLNKDTTNPAPALAS